MYTKETNMNETILSLLVFLLLILFTVACHQSHKNNLELSFFKHQLLSYCLSGDIFVLSKQFKLTKSIVNKNKRKAIYGQLAVGDI